MPNSGSFPTDRRQLEDWAGEYLGGQFSAEEFLTHADRLLKDRDLYPPGELFGLGAALGIRIENSPGLAVELVLKLMSSSMRTTRAMTVGLLHRLARLQPGFWVDSVRLLITDDDWEVRDLAARAFDDWDDEVGAAEFHEAFIVDVLRVWTQDSDERIRRAATQALLEYAVRCPEFRPRLLDVLDPLIADEREYVRRSMAAALRSIGRSDPPLVMDYLDRALRQHGETAAETVALTLDHSFADRLPDRKAELLNRL